MWVFHHLVTKQHFRAVFHQLGESFTVTKFFTFWAITLLQSGFIASKQSQAYRARILPASIFRGALEG